MKLTILGGGGFRVPLVFEQLVRDNERFADPCTEVALYDEDLSRVSTILPVLTHQAAGTASAPKVTATDRLDDALAGADFVFSAIRVGGLRGRSSDERTCLDHGLLGQETTGAAGVLYGLRTVPVALRIAERARVVCPDAWFINFTNPAGMVTEAMSSALGSRVIGICDSPLGLCHRVARALEIEPRQARFGYVGLNHLGWLNSVVVGGVDRLPDLLADPARVESFEEGKLFGADWLAALGAIPNEYLYYYYNTRQACESYAAAGMSRGEYLARQQKPFYELGPLSPEEAYRRWDATRLEREETYGAESRAGGWERDEADLGGNGYENVALALMRAISQNERTELILNVRNDGAVESVPDDAVVEVPCVVDAAGPVPEAVATPRTDQLGLMLSVKSVERDVIAAARTGDRKLAWRALGTHPLVDSTRVADALLPAAEA